MHTENENWLHFVDLILISKGCNYILVKVYSKPNKSFTYMNPGNCYPLKVENKYLKALLYNEVTHLWPRWKIRKRTFHDDARKLRYKVSRKVSVRSRMFYLTLSTTSTCAAIQNLLLMVVFQILNPHMYHLSEADLGLLQYPRWSCFCHWYKWNRFAM